MIYLAVNPQGEPWINTAAWSREECERLLRGPYGRDHGPEYLAELKRDGWEVVRFKLVKETGNG
jgi:hypothetical protein